jgi:NADH:ubiquinone oxidoreductase subunit 5 (subunit L)/multisubunit Na+/H+ antiporter MnhA subunit
VAFFGPPSGEKAAHAHEPGWSMRAPLVVLAVLAAAGGVLAAPFARLHGREYHFAFGVGPSLAALVAVGGFGLAYVAFGRGRGAPLPASLNLLERLAGSAAVNRVYEFAYRRVALGVAQGLGWLDRYVVDGLVNLVGYETLEAGSRARRIQTGFAPDYVLAAMAGVVGLAAWAVLR